MHVLRPLLVLLVSAASVVTAAAMSFGLLTPEARTPTLEVPAGGPLPIPPLIADADDIAGFNAPPVALAPPGGAIVETNVVRIPRPELPDGPRRVAIQVGHWKIDELPEEFGDRLPTQTGSSWGGVSEVEVSLDVAQRIAALLEARGLAVDIIPATVEPGYVADAFVALHSDDDGVGEKSGFKMAIGRRRGKYDQALLDALREPYAKATGLDWDAEGITSNMTGYYAWNWSRYRYALSPFTPGVIVEMGFLSSAADRAFMTQHPDVIASAIAEGVVRFLDAYPRDTLFGEDLVIQRGRFRTPTASPLPSPSASP